MEMTGHIKGRSIELDDDPGLPDGAAVRIVVCEQRASSGTAALRDTLLRFAGKIDGLPTDLAENHDSYLYGEPHG